LIEVETMAGVFGDDINSRADFQKAVALARQTIVPALQRMPNDPALQSMEKQLEAIDQWTANGRVPTVDERRSINMGIVMYRQFEATDDLEAYQLRELAGGINNYLKYWPDDAKAADPAYRPSLEDRA
jgi:hypothetical protein